MLYLGILLIILQYRRQILFERKLFSSRLHSLPLEVIRSLSYGLVGGLIASILMIGLGVVFEPTYVWIIWLISGILLLFHVRFLCLSYAVGILGIIAGLVQLFSDSISGFTEALTYHWLNDIVSVLVSIDIPSLIAIVGILHLVEAVLIKLNADRQATPLFVESKRGKLVGGYSIQSFWLLPVFMMVSPTGTNSELLFTLSWWPLLFSSITIMPVPIMIGYSDITTVYTPKEKVNKSFRYLLLYSIGLLGLAYLAKIVPPTQIFAGLFALIGHEGIRLIGKYKEEKLPPKFVHPKDGLMVLAIIPGSLASTMGIQAGEIIKGVNGNRVTNRQELYDALQQQPAFVKMEVVNLYGHIKFAQHSIYTGEHHQLGIILAPDETAPYFIELENLNLFKLIKQKITRTSRGA